MNSLGLLDISIRFPNLFGGIEIKDLPTGINLFDNGFSIAFYGIIIALGIIMGYSVALWQAKRTNQDPEIYLDFAIYAIILSILGARLYYVIFSWDYYKNHLGEIINLRQGGLAIYGGVITAVIVAIVYTRVKKLSFGLLADTACCGLICGQAIGRWGNFFNREAFGCYTDNLFAMQLRVDEVSSSVLANDSRYIENLVTIDGLEFIQVHPTFLYESAWNFLILTILLLYTKHKKFDGECFLIYMSGYGLGRFFIEGLRTDQLKIGNTDIAVSQVLAAVLFVISIILIVFLRIKARMKTDKKFKKKVLVIKNKMFRNKNAKKNSSKKTTNKKNSNTKKSSNGTKETNKSAKNTTKKNNNSSKKNNSKSKSSNNKSVTKREVVVTNLVKDKSKDK